MLNPFNKKLTNLEYQKIFLETSIEVFNSLFVKNEFKKIKSTYSKHQSIIVYKKNKKFIRIFSFHEPKDQSFFEISIGEKFNPEIDDFEGYYITIKRLIQLIKKKKNINFYSFPFGEKSAFRVLKKVKNDFLNYASFYLTESEDLFDKVLKIKGIKS